MSQRRFDLDRSEHEDHAADGHATHGNATGEPLANPDDDVRYEPFAAWMDVELTRLVAQWRHLAAPASNRDWLRSAGWSKLASPQG